MNIVRRNTYRLLLHPLHLRVPVHLTTRMPSAPRVHPIPLLLTIPRLIYLVTTVDIRRPKPTTTHPREPMALLLHQGIYRAGLAPDWRLIPQWHIPSMINGIILMNLGPSILPFCIGWHSTPPKAMLHTNMYYQFCRVSSCASYDSESWLTISLCVGHRFSFLTFFSSSEHRSNRASAHSRPHSHGTTFSQSVASQLSLHSATSLPSPSTHAHCNSPPPAVVRHNLARWAGSESDIAIDIYRG